MKYKLVIFDLDGVILDSLALVKEYVNSKYLGLTEEIEHDILCGNIFDKMKKTPLQLADDTEEERKRKRIEYIESKSRVGLFSGIPELLRYLHDNNVTLALNTSSSEDACLPVLTVSGINKYFDFIGTAKVDKSKVVKFKMIIEKYDIPTGDLIFITDTIGDLREAEVAGVPTIAVTWGAHKREHFNETDFPNLVCIVDTVDELKDFLTIGDGK